MENKPSMLESAFYFKQSNHIRGLEGLLVIPENEFDNQVVGKIARQRLRGGGDKHLLLREVYSNGLVYDSKTRAKAAVDFLNSESKKLEYRANRKVKSKDKKTSKKKHRKK